VDDVAFVGSFLFFALVGALICGLAGGIMLDRVERGLAGALLGFFLGPIGLVIAWVMRDNALRDAEAEHARRHREPDPTDRLLSRRAVSQIPLPPRAHADIDAIERLAKLREAGHLTDEEFAAKKRQILRGAPTAPPVQSEPRRFR
jgi:putative oligomerization/nucleic acid binding protein